jgi:glutaredoxin-like protein
VPLLSDRDRETVRKHLAGIEHPVTLLLFTQTIGAPETVLIAKQVLDEVATLSDLVSVEEANLVLERDRAAQYGIEQIPSIVLLKDGQDTGMRFLGAPAGYEFMSLVEAVVLAGTDDSGLTPDSKSLVAQHVSGPIDIQVFVTPTCPYCPRAVTLAHRMAREDSRIKASSVDAAEFMELSQRHRVTGVPKTVVNGATEIMGAVPEAAFVRAVLGLEQEPEPEPADAPSS